jgi:plasminogen activator
MKTRLCFALMLCSAFSTQSHAADSNTSWYHDKLTIAPSLGLLSTSSGESFYEKNNKTTQIDWRVSNTPVLKLSMDYTLDLQKTIYARLWTTLQKKTGTLNAYDWGENPQDNWTEYSHHPNSPLNHAYEIDVGVSMPLYTNPAWKHDVLGGFQFSRYNWSSYGGDYWYGSGDDVGSFPPNELGADYTQKLSALYIGLATRYTHQQWTINAVLKGSPLARIEYADNHAMFNLHFKGQVKNLWYLGSNVSVAYAMTPRLQLSMDFTYSIFFEKQGSIDMRSNSNNGKTFHRDSATAYNINRLLTFGARYSF